MYWIYSRVSTSDTDKRGEEEMPWWMLRGGIYERVREGIG
jgi:hypothetical protein